jgi:hypothetical protein
MKRNAPTGSGSRPGIGALISSELMSKFEGIVDSSGYDAAVVIVVVVVVPVLVVPPVVVVVVLFLFRRLGRCISDLSVVSERTRIAFH